MMASSLRLSDTPSFFLMVDPPRVAYIFLSRYGEAIDSSCTTRKSIECEEAKQRKMI